MPVKHRPHKSRRHRVTTSAIAAFVAGDEGAAWAEAWPLARGLRLEVEAADG